MIVNLESQPLFRIVFTDRIFCVINLVFNYFIKMFPCTRHTIRECTSTKISLYLSITLFCSPFLSNARSFNISLSPSISLSLLVYAYLYVGSSFFLCGKKTVNLGGLFANRTIINSQNISAFCNDYQTRSFSFWFRVVCTGKWAHIIFIQRYQRINLYLTSYSSIKQLLFECNSIRELYTNKNFNDVNIVDIFFHPLTIDDNVLCKNQCSLMFWGQLLN